MLPGLDGMHEGFSAWSEVESASERRGYLAELGAEIEISRAEGAHLRGRSAADRRQIESARLHLRSQAGGGTSGPLAETVVETDSHSQIVDESAPDVSVNVIRQWMRGPTWRDVSVYRVPLSVPPRSALPSARCRHRTEGANHERGEAGHAG